MSDFPPRSNFERHLQSGLAVLLIGLVAWVGVSVSSGREATARLEEKVVYLTEQIREMRIRLDDGPTRADVESNKRILEDHENRIRALENPRN